MALPDYSNYVYPDFNTGGNFPYQNFLQQLQASFNAVPMNSYGRWNGTGVTTPQGYPAPNTTPNGPPGGYGGGLLGKSGGGPTGGPTPAPGTTPSPAPSGGPAPSGSPYPQPGPDAGNPGFGAAPSSASFANLSDADKAYLYNMERQYRQDLRGQPGAHQLFFDMFGGQASPEQINGLINDIGLNNPLLGQGFNTNAYDGPLKAQYAALVQQHGGSPNSYGTWTGQAAAQADALKRFGPNVTDFRTGKKLGLLGS